MSQLRNREQMTLILCFSNNKIPTQGQLCAGVPRTALCISNSLISQVPVSAKDRWSMATRQSEKLPSQGKLVEWNDVVIPVSWRMRLDSQSWGGARRTLNSSFQLKGMFTSLKLAPFNPGPPPTPTPKLWVGEARILYLRLASWL